MNYARGLVDKNNIIRTVEDIICAGDDNSHQAINDFKDEVNVKIESVYSKDETRSEIDDAIQTFHNTVVYPRYAPRNTVYTQIETLDHIDSAITDFKTETLQKSYLTGTTVRNHIKEVKDECIKYTNDEIEELGIAAQDRINEAIKECKDNTDKEIKALFDDQLPDQYYDKGEVEDTIDDKLFDFESDTLSDYATKLYVEKKITDVVSAVNTFYYSKDHIDQNYYTSQNHNVDIEALKTKITALETKITELESKINNN